MWRTDMALSSAAVFLGIDVLCVHTPARVRVHRYVVSKDGPPVKKGIGFGSKTPPATYTWLQLRVKLFQRTKSGSIKILYKDDVSLIFDRAEVAHRDNAS